MTSHRQRDEVRLDIGVVREEDETHEDENYKDETLTWRRASRTRHRQGELQGRDLDGGVIYKDETLSWATLRT